jgi:hypothetical protein
MKDLEYYQKLKKKTKYNLKFKSSAIQKTIKSILGTIEKDASGFFGQNFNFI